MKPTTLTTLAVTAGLLAAAPLAGAATTLIDATTNNGSFETIDPHTAPITNTSGRRASSDGSSFTVSNLTVDPNTNFGGIDGSQIGTPNPSSPNRGQDGDLTLLANNGVDVTVTFDPIPITVSIGDTFELSAYTGRNANAGSFDYSFTLRFDGNAANDLVLLSGTDTTTDVWTLQASGPISAPVAASSVELIALNDNSNGGNDQTYIDNITLTHTPEPSTGLLALLALPLLARRRRS